jgi:hypothetical protein
VRTRGEYALLAQAKDYEQKLKSVADAQRAVVAKLEAQLEQLHDRLVVAHTERDSHAQACVVGAVRCARACPCVCACVAR